MSYPQNAWVNGDNFQEVSFPEEVPPPDAEPDVDVICVHYNPAWSQVLAAACDQLTQLSAWAGDDETKKLAVTRATTLKALLVTPEDCMNPCCHDPTGIPFLTRVTEDGTIQVSTDGGTTWVTDATDPRLTQPALPPISGTGDLSCQAASNIVAAFKPIIHDLSVLLTGTVALLALAVGIAGVLAVVILDPAEAYRLVPVVISFAEGMVSQTESSFFDAFTDDVWHTLLCAIQCTIGTDGIYTLDELTALKAQLETDVTDPVVLNAFNLIITGVGLLGMNNMGSQTAALDDCGDCGCGECTFSTWFTSDCNQGIVTEHDGTHAIIEAVVLGDGKYYVIYNSTDLACFYTLTVTDLVGAHELGRSAYTGTGETLCSLGHLGEHVGVPVLGVLYRSDNPFTVRLDVVT